MRSTWKTTKHCCPINISSDNWRLGGPNGLFLWVGRFWAPYIFVKVSRTKVKFCTGMYFEMLYRSVVFKMRKKLCVTIKNWENHNFWHFQPFETSYLHQGASEQHQILHTNTIRDDLSIDNIWNAIKIVHQYNISRKCQFRQICIKSASFQRLYSPQST